jgi:hypothetical protein
LKVLAHAVAQVLRLANVDDVALGILVQVATRLGGQILKFLFQCHGYNSPQSLRENKAPKTPVG